LKKNQQKKEWVKITLT